MGQALGEVGRYAAQCLAHTQQGAEGSQAAWELVCSLHLDCLPWSPAICISHVNSVDY